MVITRSFWREPSLLIAQLVWLILGISAVTARPFSPPIQFRVATRSRPLKTEKSNILEGKCHKCRKWIAVEGVKNVTVKVRPEPWSYTSPLTRPSGQRAVLVRIHGTSCGAIVSTFATGGSMLPLAIKGRTSMANVISLCKITSPLFYLQGNNGSALVSSLSSNSCSSRFS